MSKQPAISKKSPPKSKSAGKRSTTFAVMAPQIPPGSGHAIKPPVISSPSPNFASRQGHVIQELVLHNTDGPLAPSLAQLKNVQAQVSAHYVVDRTGQIYQLVDDSNTAWHSGNKLVNQQSIGIEIVAWKTAAGMTAAQEASLIALAKYVLDAYDIPLAAVVPHRSIVATDCPGWVWPTNAQLTTWKNAKLDV